MWKLTKVATVGFIGCARFMCVALGRKASLVYLINILVSTMIFAYIYDEAFPNEGAKWIAANHHHAGFAIWEYVLAVVLAALMLNTYYQSWKQKSSFQNLEEGDSSKIIESFEVSGLTCGGCVSRVRNKLLEDDNVKEISLEVAGSCQVEFGTAPDMSKIRNSIDELGFSSDIK